MGALGWVAMALVVLAVGLSVAGLVAAVRLSVRGGAQPAALAAMTAAQRWRAAAVVRRGDPVAPGQLPAVRALATSVAAQGYLLLIGAGVSALWVAMALFPLVLPWPAGVVRALFTVGAVVLAAMTAWTLHSIRRARRFLAAHRDPGAAVGTGR